MIDDISCLLVVSNDRLVGIVTKRDFLEPISQLEVVEKKLSVQFGIKDMEVTPEQQGFMMDEFDSFAHKYQEAFQLGTLFVYMKSHGNTNLRGTPLIHCRLQFRTVRGTFFSASEGWGVEPTFRVALDRLDTKTATKQRTASLQPKIRKRLPAKNRNASRRILTPSKLYNLYFNLLMFLVLTFCSGT